MTKSSSLRKYRDLLFAILLFVVLDLGILVFNFYASIQLERDAGRINAAGELRMLTQQITKSVLTLQTERRADLPIQTSMAQLSQGVPAFNARLEQISQSLAADAEFRIFRIDPAPLRDTAASIRRTWNFIESGLQPVLANAQSPAVEDVEDAVNRAVARNIRLMALCDDLAAQVEAAARTKTGLMRTIQVTAILLALVNFLYIVFKFLRQLGRADRVAERARKETDDILNTVSEGLLLVGRDGLIAGQFSASVPGLLGTPVRAGDDFRAILRRILSESRAQEALTYLDLLFDPKVKPALLRQLDPLRDVELVPDSDSGPDSAPRKPGEQGRFLTFRISQVKEGAEVIELLVTVFDVTERVRLERELAQSQQAARSDIDELLNVLEREPRSLQDFLLDARARLADLNTLLKDAGQRGADYPGLVVEAFRTVHGLKGEAAALGMGSVARQAHRLEDVLEPLRRRTDVRGDDFIAVVLELSHLQELVERFGRVFNRVDDMVTQAPAPARGGLLTALSENLRQLALRTAEATGKHVQWHASLPEHDVPAEVVQALREVLPQLVRNSVVHGIEAPEQRAAVGKHKAGSLVLDIRTHPDSGIEVVVGDDGRGIAAADVRRRAVEIGHAADEVAAYSDAQVLSLIFDPNFTTATEVTEHAGRGVGLSVVRQITQRIGARLRVMTQPNMYTRFVLTFPSAVTR